MYEEGRLWGQMGEGRRAGNCWPVHMEDSGEIALALGCPVPGICAEPG